MAGQLKLGLDLSGQTLHFYTTTSKALPTSTTTILETTGGYSIVGDSENYRWVKPVGNPRILYTANARVNFDLDMDDDVGFITAINDELGFLDIISRDHNVRLYGFTEDGNKVAIPVSNSIGKLTITENFSVAGNTYTSIEKNYPISDLSFKPNFVVLNGLTTNHSGSLSINAFSAELSGDYIHLTAVIRNLGSNPRTDSTVTWSLLVM